MGQLLSGLPKSRNPKVLSPSTMIYSTALDKLLKSVFVCPWSLCVEDMLQATKRNSRDVFVYSTLIPLPCSKCLCSFLCPSQLEFYVFLMSKISFLCFEFNFKVLSFFYLCLWQVITIYGRVGACFSIKIFILIKKQEKCGWQEKMHFMPSSNYIWIYTHTWRVNVLFCILCFCLPIHGN